MSQVIIKIAIAPVAFIGNLFILDSIFTEPGINTANIEAEREEVSLKKKICSLVGLGVLKTKYSVLVIPNIPTKIAMISFQIAVFCILETSLLLKPKTGS